MTSSLYSSVGKGERVLVVWGDLGEQGSMFQEVVESLQLKVGPSPRVAVENEERLRMAGHTKSSFASIFSGCAGLATVDHTLDLLADLAMLLIPGGNLTIVQAVGEEQGPSAVTSQLVLAGLTPSPSPPSRLDETLPAVLGTRDRLGKVDLYSTSATKPTHEIGASRPLSFAKPAALAPPTAGVWTLEDMEDDTVELVDDSTLLDESDLAKVDPASLRVCGTTGRRKACKDCSCGLSEELAEGKQPVMKSVSSSCGSCYLGDAFRCGSCPYLGMPAFKPGEKIQLSTRQMNPDLREVA